jgi:hypothetical protein
VFEPTGLGGPQIAFLAIESAITIMVLAVACMLAAVLGAGLRLLWWRLRGESVRGRLGISSENNGTA